MPNKPNGNRKSNSKNQADWQKFEFVELRLTDTDKADFKAKLAKEPQHFLSEVDGVSKLGYKFSLSYDTGNNAVIATMTCKEALDPNFNYILSARAGDVWEALSLLLYKHMYMCDDGNWGGDDRQSSQEWG